MYKFPARGATHIVDENNKTVLDVPKWTEETEQEWNSRKKQVLKWLNEGKIYIIPQ